MMKHIIRNSILCIGILSFLRTDVVFSQEADSLYYPFQVDSLPYILCAGNKLSLEEYLLENMPWTDAMHEPDRLTILYTITKNGELKDIEYRALPVSCEACLVEFKKVIGRIKRVEPARKNGKNVSFHHGLTFKFRIRREELFNKD